MQDSLYVTMHIFAVASGWFYGNVISIRVIDGDPWSEAIFSVEFAMALVCTVLTVACFVARHSS